MANTKVGLDYFELDCLMEEKVRLIQAEFGLKGFAVVVKLYQKIYGELGYYCEWSEDSLLLFMSENGVPGDSRNMIKEIVSACVRRNIFSENLFRNFGILTSCGVQKRYMKATSRREKVIMKKEYLLLSDGEINSNVDIIGDSAHIITENADGIGQRREEKSKGKKKNLKERAEEREGEKRYFSDDALNGAFLDFMDMRRKIRKPMTDRAAALAVRKLKELAADSSGGLNAELAVGILEQSVMNCWQGLFPLKETEGRKGKGTARKNAFNEFARNEYDFTDLEKDLLAN